MRYLYPSFLALLIACGRTTPPTIGASASLPGPWKIVKVVRNQDNITAGSDFGAALITLDADSTYSLSKTALFVTTNNGTWSARPQPGGYNIVLKSRQNDSPATYEMSYDTSQKNIIVNFTTTSSNTYQYTLEKANPSKE